MAIKTPHWVAKQRAFPTAKGWTRIKRNGRPEVLKSASFTAEDIAEWHATLSPEVEPAPAPIPEPIVQTLNEAPSHNRPLHDEEIEHYYNDIDEAVDNSFTD